MRELAPVERAPRLVDLALGEALLARGDSHGIGGFKHQQRLIAEDGVNGQEGSSELRGKLLARAKTHYSTRGAGGLAEASRRRICCTMSVRMSRKSSCSSCSFARISASL